MKAVKTSQKFHSIKSIKNSPVGHISTQLKSIYSVISYEEDKTKYISDIMRRTHIQSAGFFDSSFIQNEIYRHENERVLFIDLGAEYTTVSIWTNRGPLYFEKLKIGQRDITNALATKLDIGTMDADELKILVSNALPNEMDRFTPASSSEKFSRFSRADINEIFVPELNIIINHVYNQSKKYIEQYKPEKIILTGGGTAIANIDNFVEQIFNLPVDNQTETATIMHCPNIFGNQNYLNVMHILKDKKKFITD